MAESPREANREAQKTVEPAESRGAAKNTESKHQNNLFKLSVQLQVCYDFQSARKVTAGHRNSRSREVTKSHTAAVRYGDESQIAEWPNSRGVQYGRIAETGGAASQFGTIRPNCTRAGGAGGADAGDCRVATVITQIARQAATGAQDSVSTDSTIYSRGMRNLLIQRRGYWRVGAK